MAPTFQISNVQPSPPDQRDIPFVPKTLPPYPASIDLMPDVEEVKDQGPIGSCVANGIVEACEMMAKIHGHDLILSRMFLYTATLNYEGRLGQEGLTMRDAYKVGYHYGIPLEADYPYDLTKDEVRPPDDAYLAASAMRIERYEAVVAPTLLTTPEPQDRIDRIKAALDEGLAVDIALAVSESLRHLTGPWHTHQYQLLGPDVPTIGGHCMRIIGYDDSCGLWLVENSWGKVWGDGGFCGLPFAIVREPFFEAWLVRDFNGWQIPEAPGIKFEGVNHYRLEARIVPAADELGKAFNIWMGARAPGGTIFLRDPIPAEQMNMQGGGFDNWTVHTGGNFMPTVSSYVLAADNEVVVVGWRDLSAMAGFEVYLAYGQTPLDWKLQKLCTIPQFS